MNCPVCGHPNREGALFCGECRAPLASELICTACGRRNPPGQKFCDGCSAFLRAVAAPHVPPPSAPASFASGRYRVKRLLGEGAKKRVYLAYDQRLDREVAIGLIKREGLDAEGRARVRREAQAMGRLGNHPNLVTVHDVVEEGDDLYIVSEYMAGGDLASRLAEASEHRLPLDAALRIAEQVCDALEHAHSRGVIHRDLKPGNVWLSESGDACLGDFGLALSLDRSRLTREGMLVGTAAYLAPEQALGRPPDVRGDLYGLGALLYEMLTGRPPFLGDDAVAVISQHLHTTPVAPTWHNPEIPKPLENLILELLAKDPEERPATAAEVRKALAAIRAVPTAEMKPEQKAEALPLDRLASGVFVGRERELEEARACLEKGFAGRGQVLLLVGEAGIGKTRTAEELTTYARMRGAQVLWGRGYEGEGAPAYWPWVQIIRAYVHDRAPDELRSDMGSGAPDIAEVVSEVRERLPDLATPPKVEPDQARFRLLDSVGTFLQNAARRTPLVLILDDLHWADRGSLLLLEFLAQELGESRIGLVGTYRDVELSRGHPLERALAEVARTAAPKRIPLRGLEPLDVQRYIERAAHLQPPRELVETVYRETEGNPFFVQEVVRLLQAEGRLDHPEEVGTWRLGVPEGIRQVIDLRLEKLSEDCGRMLGVASVLGREFREAELERASELAREELLELLEEANAARVIEAVGGAPRSHRFTHALIRETVYGELTASRRLALHRRVGEALEDLYSPELEPHLSRLSYHFAEAAVVGEVEKAVDYASRAAERAERRHAAEEMVEHLERALEALELREGGDPELRCDLLIRLAEARGRAGELARQHEAALDAAELARQLGSAERLARAAIAYHPIEAFVSMFEVDPLRVSLIEDALAMLGSRDPGLRAHLLTCLGKALYAQPDTERTRAICAEAVAEARQARHPILVIALEALQNMTPEPKCLQGFYPELRRVAEASGDRNLFMNVEGMGIEYALERGDRAELERRLEAEVALAEELRVPGVRYWVMAHGAMRACLEGRFEESRRLSEEARVIGERVYGPLALQFWTIQMIFLGALTQSQDELGPLISGLEAVAHARPSDPLVGAMLASLYAAGDAPQQCREQFEVLAAQDFRSFIPFVPAVTWGPWVGCAEACAYLGDTQRAEILYELGLPWGDLHFNGGVAIGYGGAFARHLGLLATLLGRFDTAERHFERAIEGEIAIGSPPWLARARRDYARMLLRRGGRGDREKALQLLNLALGVARELGMRPLVEDALAAKLELQRVEPGDLQGSIHAVARSIAERPPDLAPHAAPDGTVTLLFSDMVGFTAMTERLGDLRAREVVREHNRIVREQLAAHGGYEAGVEGDGFFLAFGSARQALLCATAIQRRLATRNETADEPIRVRIGLHTGEVLRDAEEFFGRSVILASRIADQARGEEILISSVVRELTQSIGDVRFGEPRDLDLKGIAEPQRVFSVVWT